MTRFIDFNSDLQTIAGKMVAHGDADYTVEFLNELVSAINRHYGTNGPLEYRADVFVSRMRECLDPEVRYFLQLLLEKVIKDNA